MAYRPGDGSDALPGSHGSGIEGPDGAVVDGTHLVCVVDLLGQSGRFAALLGQWQVAAMSDATGMRPALNFYTNADIAIADYRAGKCPAVALPVSARPDLLPAIATLEAVRAVPDNRHAQVLLQVLLSGNSSLEKLLKTDDAVLAGLLATGNNYLLTAAAADADSLEQLITGRQIAAVNDNQGFMISQLGGTPVSRDMTSFAAAFNNGLVQGVLASAYQIDALEIYRGAGKQGALVMPPLYQSWYQLIAKPGYFSDSQLAWTRKTFYETLTTSLVEQLNSDDAQLSSLPSLALSQDATATLDANAQQQRLAQRGELYDADMLSLMRKVRCKLDASRKECVNPVE